MTINNRTKNSIKINRIKILLPVLILFVGGLGTIALLNMKKPPKTKKRDHAPLIIVDTITAEEKSYKIVVETNGKTRSFTTLTISSEIKGRVTWINEKFTEGGWVEKNTRLFQINPEDYRLKVEQAKASYAQAEYELTLALTKQKSALRQKRTLSGNNRSINIPDLNRQLSSLAKYEPQVKYSQAALKSANASLKQAQLELKRTTIRAPFDGYINSVDIAKGQLIQSAQTAGTLVKYKPVIIKASISLEELSWINVAEKRDQILPGSIAEVSKKIGEKNHLWKGEVKRVLQEVDTLGRNVIVLIDVNEIQSNHGRILPLGLFVDVKIKGNIMENTIGIPQESLRTNSSVWLLSENSELKIQEVKVKWRTDKKVLISKGIKTGDKIITSYLSTPVPGMKLKLFDPSSEKEKGKGRTGKQENQKNNVIPAGF